MEGNAHRGSLRQGALAPFGAFGDGLENAAHAGHIVAFVRLIAQQFQAEGHRVFAGSVREFVNERLHDEALGIGSRRTQGAGLQGQRHGRHMNGEIGYEVGRELRGIDAGR